MRGLLVLFLVIFAVSCKSEEKPGDLTIDFITGFLEGIEEKGDIKELIKCIIDMEHVVEEIIRALKLIMTFEFKKVIEGVVVLIESIKKFIAMLAPCSKGFVQIERLLNAILETDLTEIFMKIMNNPGTFLELLTKAVQAYSKENYHDLGFNVGRIMFKLYLEE